VTAPTAPPAVPSDLEARYECLRQAALGAPLPPDARQGLLLLLRRGLWAWARALTVLPIAPAMPHRAAPASPCAEHAVIIHILAAMALAPPERSAHE
jgi:hypothetical protein